MHGFTIRSQSWNRSGRHMSGLQSSVVQAQSAWGALRAWWQYQRHYEPLVKVLAVQPRHTHACRVELPTTWAYMCNQA